MAGCMDLPPPQLRGGVRKIPFFLAHGRSRKPVAEEASLRVEERDQAGVMRQRLDEGIRVDRGTAMPIQEVEGLAAGEGRLVFRQQLWKNSRDQKRGRGVGLRRGEGLALVAALDAVRGADV